MESFPLDSIGETEAGRRRFLAAAFGGRKGGNRGRGRGVSASSAAPRVAFAHVREQAAREQELALALREVRPDAELAAGRAHHDLRIAAPKRLGKCGKDPGLAG